MDSQKVKIGCKEKKRERMKDGNGKEGMHKLTES
jgi:hypothetical protein